MSESSYLHETSLTVGHLTSEYLYTGDYTRTQSQDTEQLLEVLRLSHYWKMEVLLDEVQVDLINHISLENYAERESFK